MKTLLLTTLIVTFSATAVLAQSLQSLIIPDVVDGGGWQSTLVLTNSSASAASATLTFHADTSGGATSAWTPSFLEASSTTGMVLGAGSTLYLHTPGTAATLTQGWAQLDSDVGVVAYVIFTNRVTGHQDQDATAPAVAASNRILVPYDDASGFVTALAIVNPTNSPQPVSVGFRTVEGGVAIDSLPTPIPAFGHQTFVLSQQFPQIAGHRGLAEFYSATGNLSMISLRFNPTQSSASAPVYFESGPPLITADSGTPYDPNQPYMYRARSK